MRDHIKTSRSFLVAVVPLVLTAAVLWFARPHRPPPPHLVEPRLSRLQEPYTSISAYYVLDGGSLGIEIVDAAGCKEQFAIPCRLGSTEKYQRVFVGALLDSHPNAVEVADSAATKRALIYLLAQNRNGDPYVDSALALLGNRPLDYARCLAHRYQGHYNR